MKTATSLIRIRMRTNYKPRTVTSTLMSVNASTVPGGEEIYFRKHEKMKWIRLVILVRIKIAAKKAAWMNEKSLREMKSFSGRRRGLTQETRTTGT